MEHLRQNWYIFGLSPKEPEDNSPLKTKIGSTWELPLWPERSTCVVTGESETSDTCLESAPRTETDLRLTQLPAERLSDGVFNNLSPSKWSRRTRSQSSRSSPELSLKKAKRTLTASPLKLPSQQESDYTHIISILNSSWLNNHWFYRFVGSPFVETLLLKLGDEQSFWASFLPKYVGSTYGLNQNK